MNCPYRIARPGRHGLNVLIELFREKKTPFDLLLKVVSEDVLLTWDDDKCQRSLGELARSAKQGKTHEEQSQLKPSCMANYLPYVWTIKPHKFGILPQLISLKV